MPIRLFHVISAVELPLTTSVSWPCAQTSMVDWPAGRRLKLGMVDILGLSRLGGRARRP